MKALCVFITALIMGCAGMLEYERVPEPMPWMVDIGSVSRVTGDQIATGHRWSQRMVYGYFGEPLAEASHKGGTAAAWRTNSPKYTYFVGLFHDGALFGFDFGLEDFPELQIKTNAMERVLLSRFIRGFRMTTPQCTRKGCGI